MENNNELITLEIEGLPPTVNMMYRGLQGHRFKTKTTLEYQITLQINSANYGIHNHHTTAAPHCSLPTTLTATDAGTLITASRLCKTASH